MIIREKVDHSGIFDFGAFYNYAHSWFRDEEYGVDEEKYSEKISANKRDILIEWKAVKRISDYFSIEMKLKFEIKNLTDVEVEIDGTKKKMNKGDISVDIRGTLVKDPEGKWETSPYARFLRDTYNKYIIPSRVMESKLKTSSEVKTIKEEMKAFLELTGRR